MHDPKAVVTLYERDVQAVEQAVLDADAAAALEFPRDVLRPAIEAFLNRGHCKPYFELPRGRDLTVTRPPSAGDPEDT